MAVTKTQGITAASLVAAIPLVWGGQATLDNRYAPKDEYVTVGELKQLSVDIWYGQFFDRLDDYDESVAEGNEPLAKIYKRQLLKLLAKICEEDQEFEYCQTGIPD